jgi:hypothetical protein
MVDQIHLFLFVGAENFPPMTTTVAAIAHLG